MSSWMYKRLALSSHDAERRTSPTKNFHMLLSQKSRLISRVFCLPCVIWVYVRNHFVLEVQPNPAKVFFFSIDVVVKLKAHFCPYYNVVRSMWSGVNCGIKSPLMPLHCPCTAIRLVVRYFTFQRNQLLRCYFCFSLTYRHHKLVRKTRLWVCSQLRAGGTHALVVLLGHRRETSVH